MTCLVTKTPDGGSFSCSHGKRPPVKANRCQFCHNWYVKLCDYRVEQAVGELDGTVVTCDAKMCRDHATEVGPNKDICPNHIKAFKQRGGQ